MDLKSVNKVNDNRYELEVSINSKEFENAVDKAYKKEVGKINIPGFRKGKAPRSFIERYYGKKIFYDEAINSLYPDALDQAVKEARLDVIDDKIDFDIVEVSENGLIFKAVLTVKPEAKINNYKGIEVSNNIKDVTDEDIDKEIQKIREKNARIISVEDRAAKNGDVTVIDFEGFCDGVAFEGGKAQNHELVLGEGHFIKGFEEQIVGHKIGEEFDIIVTFPEDYQAENLAGKESMFKVKLNSIKEKEIPDFDDEFVKDVSEFDGINEYRDDIRKKLVQQNEIKNQDEIENQIIDKIVDKLEANIPEAMYKNKIKEMVRDFEYRLQSQGLDIKSYMKYTGMNEEKFNETFKPQAERQVKFRLALESIAKLEDFEVSENEFEDSYVNISKQYNMEMEKIKNIVTKDQLKKDILVEKSMNFIKDNLVKI